VNHRSVTIFRCIVGLCFFINASASYRFATEIFPPFAKAALAWAAFAGIIYGVAAIACVVWFVFSFQRIKSGSPNSNQPAAESFDVSREIP
jgi:hypothetical protein